jgi:hypothetical protein
MFYPNMIHEIDNRGQKVVNEDIKRILIDRDITTIKQAFYKILVLKSEIMVQQSLFHINSFLKVVYKVIY